MLWFELQLTVKSSYRGRSLGGSGDEKKNRDGTMVGGSGEVETTSHVVPSQWSIRLRPVS
jgi:hypothetical protein